MSEPQFSVEGVLDALAMQPRRREGAGRAIMFVAARKLEGTTTAARAVAATRRGRAPSMPLISICAATRWPRR